MNILLNLPDGILHYIYSDWLKLKDLSRLDIACCVEQNAREMWVSSLSGLNISKNSKYSGYISDDNMAKFYIWLSGRNMLLVEEEFRLKLNLVKSLVEGLDMKSYCLTIRSICFTAAHRTPLPNELEDNLSIFFSHCKNLQAVTMRDIPESDRVLRVLCETLRDNSLIKIDLTSYFSHFSPAMIAEISAKHAKTLRELRFFMHGPGLVKMSTIFMNNNIHLKVLELHLGRHYSQPMESWLLPYLSSGGGSLLESLVVGGPSKEIDHCLVPIAKSCRKLKRLVLQNAGPCSTESILFLYEECPDLKYVTIDGSIKTDEKSTSVDIKLRHNETWAVCLCYALRRSEFKNVRLALPENYHDSVAYLKTMLEPYKPLHFELTRPDSSSKIYFTLDKILDYLA